MTQFTCHGPFPIAADKFSAGKIITKETVKYFWESNPDFGSKIGCYIFGMRAGKGVSPIYVGKATKGYAQEVFSYHKLTKYQHALAMYKSGTPVLYFISYPTDKKGAINIRHISSLEKFLIQQAAVSNPLLLNINHTKTPEWGISGVLRSSTKKPTNGAAALKKLLYF